jgi:hypothetical protein
MDTIIDELKQDNGRAMEDAVQRLVDTAVQDICKDDKPNRQTWTDWIDNKFTFEFNNIFTELYVIVPTTWSTDTDTTLRTMEFKDGMHMVMGTMFKRLLLETISS